MPRFIPHIDGAEYKRECSSHSLRRMQSILITVYNSRKEMKRDNPLCISEKDLGDIPRKIEGRTYGI